MRRFIASTRASNTSFTYLFITHALMKKQLNELKTYMYELPNPAEQTGLIYYR